MPRKDAGGVHKGEHLAQVVVEGRSYDVHAWGEKRRRVYQKGRYLGMYYEEKDFQEGVRVVLEGRAA